MSLGVQKFAQRAGSRKSEQSASGSRTKSARVPERNAGGHRAGLLRALHAASDLQWRRCCVASLRIGLSTHEHKEGERFLLKSL